MAIIVSLEKTTLTTSPCGQKSAGAFSGFGLDCAQVQAMAGAPDPLRTDMCVPVQGTCACTGTDECFAIPSPPGGYVPSCAPNLTAAAATNGGISTTVIKLACSNEDISAR